MKTQPFCLSNGYTNTYVASDGIEACIIDAPDSVGPVLEYIEKEGLSLRCVLLTHGHYDHILGLGEIRRAYPEIPIYISKEDISFLEDGGKANRDILSYFPGMTKEMNLLKTLPENYEFYENEAWKFKVIRTPGHTMGSVCLYSKDEGVLFSGDTLFEGSIGRHDLGGSFSDLRKSLSELKKLEGKTLVLPGHGGFTTIEREIKSNPYM